MVWRLAEGSGSRDNGVFFWLRHKFPLWAPGKSFRRCLPHLGHQCHCWGTRGEAGFASRGNWCHPSGLRELSLVFQPWYVWLGARAVFVREVMGEPRRKELLTLSVLGSCGGHPYCCVMGWGCACPWSGAPRDGFCVGVSTAGCGAAHGCVVDVIMGSGYMHRWPLASLVSWVARSQRGNLPVWAAGGVFPLCPTSGSCLVCVSHLACTGQRDALWSVLGSGYRCKGQLSVRFSPALVLCLLLELISRPWLRASEVS